VPAVTIPGVGRVNFPDGMPLSEIQTAAAKLAEGVGRDPNTGKSDPNLAILDELMAGTRPDVERTRRYPLSLGPFGKVTLGGPLASAAQSMSNVEGDVSTPIVMGTMGSLAFPPSAVASGGSFAASLLGRFGPSVLGSGVGGAAGGALAESRDPDATAGSIARAGLKSGATMAAAEAGGLALGGVVNKLVAPNLGRYADPMKPVRERIAGSGLPQFLRGSVSRLTEQLPTSGRVGTAVQRTGSALASPLGGELLEAAVIPAAAALGGPTVAIPLWLARAALAPSVLQKYLSRSGLPPELVRTLSRQATTTAIRASALEEQRK